MIYKNYLIEENINNLKENIFLFHGENFGFKEEIKDKIKEKNKNAKVINFIQDDLLKNQNIFFNEVLNESLFDEKKIYIINNTNDKILDIIKDVELRLEDQELYLFSEILDRRSKLRNHFEKSKKLGTVACYADNELSIKKIIQNKLKDFKGLTPENINIITENCNLDRVKLNNELNKIKTFFNEKKIEKKKLEELLDVKINDNFNLLKDSALNGNRIKTNKLLSDTTIDEVQNIYYLAIINQRLNKLAEILKLSKNVNLEEAINLAKPPIFWKDKTIFSVQARKWNTKKINEILKKTYYAEIEIKSNSMVKKNTLMKKLILDMCELANAS